MRIIKFIIATSIFYALLAFNVFHIGETLVPSTKDYLDIQIPTEDKDIEESFYERETGVQTGTQHYTAENNYDRLRESLCKRIAICDKIQFNGTYSSYENYSYTRAVAWLVDFINKNNTQEKDINANIKKIDINKDTGKRRWYATRESIILNLWSVWSKKEFAELLTHEMWHITDLWYIQWSALTKDKVFTEFGKIVFAKDDISLLFYNYSRESETIRKAEAKKKDFCSGYGMSDPFEDLAECFNLYINHNILFKEIAKSNTTLKKKYNFIAGIFDGKYMSSNSKELNLLKTNTTRRPRDTTKLNTN